MPTHSGSPHSKRLLCAYCMLVLAGLCLGRYDQRGNVPSTILRLAPGGTDLASSLQAIVSGPVLTEESSGSAFEESCTSFLAPGYPDDYSKRAAIVLRADGVSDVQAAVKFAKSKDLPLAVRGGGHSWRRLFVADRGLTLDLTSMNNVTVDPDEKIVVMGGGAVMNDVMIEANPHDLAISWGICLTTGLGTPLGGGEGPLARPYGIAADNILAAKLVLANGSLITVDEQQNSDVLAVVRGGGQTLGVVVELTMRLVDVAGYQGIAGAHARNPDGSNAGMRTALDWSKNALSIKPLAGIELDQSLDDAGELIVKIWAGIPGATSDAELAQFLQIVQNQSDASNAQAQLRTFYELMDMMNDDNEKFPYLSNYQVVFHLTYAQATDEFLDVLEQSVFRDLPPNVTSFASWQILGSTVAENAVRNTSSFTPFAGEIDAQIFIVLAWPPGESNEQNWQYGESVRRKLEPYVTKTQAYANHGTFVSGEWLASQVGGEGHLAQLREMKQKLDPNNLFYHHAYIGLVPDGTDA